MSSNEHNEDSSSTIEGGGSDRICSAEWKPFH